MRPFKSLNLSFPSQSILRFWQVFTLLVDALSFGSVDAFLRNKVTNRLGESTLAQLSGNQSIYSVLQLINLLVASYFGLVEVF